jgi:accessory secretory protein Asp2
VHVLKLNVLQLGKNNWQTAYQIPAALNWHFNDLSCLEDPKARLQLIVISESVTLAPTDWQLLQQRTDPYNVIQTADLAIEDDHLAVLSAKNGGAAADYADSRVYQQY